MTRGPEPFPPAPPRATPNEAELPSEWSLARTLVGDRKLVALCGAGMSTRSGIPDYRGPGTRERARNPVQFAEFSKSAAARQRYWARATLGWPRFRAVEPNPAHAALVRLEATGRLETTITQNVDRLHHRAGARAVIELHGALHECVCLDCGDVSFRDDFHARVSDANPGFTDAVGRIIEQAPDGDVEIPLELIDGFVVPGCEACEGRIKPRVVFFGENVPAPTVRAAYDALEGSELLLVAGSSLTVFSGYRFVRRARALGIPVIIVGFGPTRGDAEADLKIEAELAEFLPWFADALGSKGSEASTPNARADGRAAP